MILIYTEEITPRLQYTANLIFTQILKVEVEISTNRNDFTKSVAPKINYSSDNFGGGIFIHPHTLLFEKGILSQNINPIKYNNEVGFFESGAGSAFPFDPFAASFFVATRYEEYPEHETDAFGRFKAESCLLYKNGLLKIPVVHDWATLLAGAISQSFPGYTFPNPKFDFITTIDIDNAWAYKNKGFARTLGASLKSIFHENLKDIITRLNVLSGKEKDPYHTYEYLDSVFSGNEEKVKFFFLLGDYAKHDKNVSHENKQFRTLINETALKYDVGIHPSNAGFKHGCYGKVIRESKRLQNIVGKECTKLCVATRF